MSLRTLRLRYVLVSPDVGVAQHAILSDSWDGRFPSPHPPVVAAVEPECR